MLAGNFGFRMWRLTRAPRRSIPGACRMLCSNVRGLSKNLSDVTMASSQYDLLLCFWDPGFGRPVLLCRDGMPRARGMAVYVRDGYGVFRQPKFECGCCEMVVFWVCGARQNFYLFCLYRNPDLNHRIYAELCALVNKPSGASAGASDLKY